MSPAAALRVITDSMNIKPINEHPEYAAALKKQRAIETRHAQAVEREHRLRKRFHATTTELRAADAKAAQKLVAGDRLEIAGDPAIEAAIEEQRILITAIVEARTEVEAVRNTLRADVLKALAPEGKRRLKRIAEAQAELRSAGNSWLELVMAVRDAGFTAFESDMATLWS
jgi:hypothetical protein